LSCIRIGSILFLQILKTTMETLKFKTNLKCSGCIATITPIMNADENIGKWQVDLENADRILTVETVHSAGEVSEILKKAGYTAQKIA
jgi:copper chaperone